MKRMMMGCLGRIKEVSLTNLAVNGNFTNTSGWTGTGSVFSVSGNVANFLANSQTDLLYQSPSVTNTRKYYACGWTTAASGANITMGLGDGGTVSAAASYTGAGSYQFWGVIITAGRTGNGNLWAIVDNRASGWNSVGSQYISLMDLTTSFGSGNEPTVAQMSELMDQFSNKWLNGTQTALYFF